MKSTGIVRQIDELGRVVVPMELRKTFNITPKTPLEIFTQDDTIILCKWKKSCIICDSQDNLKNLKGKMICENCIDDINNII
jgi:transcriptional pleiotropic regulator of transition state genes